MCGEFGVQRNGTFFFLNGCFERRDLDATNEGVTVGTGGKTIASRARVRWTKFFRTSSRETEEREKNVSFGLQRCFWFHAEGVI